MLRTGLITLYLSVRLVVRSGFLDIYPGFPPHLVSDYEINRDREPPHIGNVRIAISTTRCNSLRLVPPAAWTAIP